MPDCVTSDSSAECRPECPNAKPCAVDGAPPLSGATLTAAEMDRIDRLSIGRFDWYLPGGANLPSVPKCPDTHVFLLNPGDSAFHEVAFPPRYWAVEVPSRGLPGTYSSVVELACTTAQADRIVDHAFFSPPTQALLIATTDPNAEPFVLTLYSSQ